MVTVDLERLLEPLWKRLTLLGVPSEELEELRRIRDRFKEELVLRIRQQTAALEREKKQAVDEKERVDTIVRSLGEGLVVVDNEGKIQLMNPAAEKLLGLRHTETKGIPISRLIEDEHESDRVTKEIELKEEHQRVLQASSAVIENEEGKTIGMVTILTDVTKQKEQDDAKSESIAQQFTAQIERLVRLKQFLAPQIAELIVTGEAEDPLKTHRREVTVVFVDLRGFTAFAEISEPEEVMAVLHEYHDEIGNLILAHNGTLERFTGDGMMVVFNDPVPIANPAESAIRMALAMRERVASLIVRWRKRGYELDLGIGIAQGYATIGTIGFEGHLDYTAIGTVTNLASRLCAEAKPGQILVSQRLLATVEELVEAEPVGELSLKGFHQRVAAYNILSLTG